MTEKFGRNYRLTIFPLDGGAPIIVTMPFTLNFRMQVDIGAELNRLELEVYNLSEANRQRIYQDRFVLGNYFDAAGQPVLDAQGNDISQHNIVLELGYGTLYQVFYGRIFRASSAREGTNIVTRIEAFEGNPDVAGTQTFTTLQSGQTLGSVVKFLIGQFPNLTLGAVGDLPQVFHRPVVLNGNTWELLKRYSNDNVYISQGKVYVMKEYEVLDVTAIMNAETGLLETPRRDEGMLILTTLMEAGIRLNQMVQLESIIQKEYNGTYKVNTIIHQGTISGAVSGNCRSIFKLLAQNQFPNFTVVPQA